MVCISRCGPALEPVLSIDTASSHMLPCMTKVVYTTLGQLIPPSAILAGSVVTKWTQF